MLRNQKKLCSAITLLLLCVMVSGCASGYQSSSKSKLDYWAPKDPWPNQKEGICCFVYKDPSEENVIAATAAREQSNRELEEPKVALAEQQREIATLKRELEAAQSANSALDRDKMDLAKELHATRAERAELAAQLEAGKSGLATLNPTLRLSPDAEKTDSGRQFQESETALKPEPDSAAAIQKKNAELAKKLEETQAALAQKTAQEAELERSIKSMEQALKPEIGEQTGSVRRTENSFSVELADRILFDSGSAKISTEGLKIIKRIAETLIKERAGTVIHVEGHTDDVPIRESPPPKFSSNWELSAARAGNVVHYLEKQGIKPEQLSAAGYSFTRPAVPNKDDAARARNRRSKFL